MYICTHRQKFLLLSELRLAPDSSLESHFPFSIALSSKELCKITKALYMGSEPTRWRGGCLLGLPESVCLLSSHTTSMVPAPQSSVAQVSNDSRTHKGLSRFQAQKGGPYLFFHQPQPQAGLLCMVLLAFEETEFQRLNRAGKLTRQSQN